MTTLLESLRDTGAVVVPHSGWSTRTRPGIFKPIFIQPHWTAAFSSASNPHPSLNVVINGLRNLPGPLYHILIDWYGRVHLIHRRVGNHSGRGSLSVASQAGQGIWLPRPPSRGSGDAVLNTLAWGVAADYHPAQGAMTTGQRQGMVNACVGLHNFMRWNTVRMADHWMTTNRKIDLHTIDIRPQVRVRLVEPLPEPKDNEMFIVMKNGVNYWLCSDHGWRGSIGTMDTVRALEARFGDAIDVDNSVITAFERR